MQVKMDRVKQDNETRAVSDTFVSKILVYATVLEQHLTWIIITRFTNNPMEKAGFITYFEKTSFERKIELVQLILKTSYPDLFKQYKTTFTQLHQLRDHKNKISHYHRSYEYDGKKTVFVLSPSVVRLTKDKKGSWIGKNVKKFTISEMKNLMAMVEKCDFQVRKLMNEIVKLNKNVPNDNTNNYGP